MSIAQVVKDRVSFELRAGEEHNMLGFGATVRLDQVDKADSTVKVSLHAQWITAEDAEELAVFFKKLTKKLRAL